MEKHKIKLLSLDVAEKIAAGEVVEQPYCAVKELVENAIDAKANRITIEIKDRGIELIKITDNGFGMNKADLELCIMAHATSKITTIDDLEKIDTMGFRGEALATISRVSKFQIKTREKDSDIGYSLITNGGEKPVISEIGMNTGTQIIVKDLFYNTPARRKFLKSKQSEYLNIISTIENISLSHPNINFKLIIDDKEKLNLNAVSNKMDRIKDIFGEDLIQNLIPMNLDNGVLKIEGFISKPEFIAKKRNNYFLFINNRFVVSKLVIGAINNAYSEYIVKGRYPIVFLFIKISGEYFDVNVHPRKIDIKFVNEQAIFTAIKQAIILNLSSRTNVYLSSRTNVYLSSRTNVRDLKISPPMRTSFERGRNDREDGNDKIDNQNNKQFFQNLKKVYEPITKLKEQQNLLNDEYIKKTKDFNFKKEQKLSSVGERQDFALQKTKEQHEDIFIVGWLPKKFILAYNKNHDLILIDQHASHERINYEQLKKDFLDNKIEIQGLLIPENIELKKSEFEVCIKNIKNFEKFGFFIEEFGVNSIKITALPAIIEKGREILSFLAMLEIILANPDIDILKNQEIIDKIIMIACKNSIKANQKLSFEEMNKLLKDLFKCENPYHCPHGRPTIIVFNEKDIDKKFARIV